MIIAITASLCGLMFLLACSLALSFRSLMEKFLGFAFRFHPVTVRTEQVETIRLLRIGVFPACREKRTRHPRRPDDRMVGHPAQRPLDSTPKPVSHFHFSSSLVCALRNVYVSNSISGLAS